MYQEYSFFSRAFHPYIPYEIKICLGPGFENEDYEYWQFHALYYPPLLRSATVKKFMVSGSFKKITDPDQIK